MSTVLTWIVSGLAAGWLARFAVGSRRDFGIVGDLILGSLGGLVGGWLFKRVGVTPPSGLAAHVLVAVSGAAALVGAARILRRIVIAGRARSKPPAFELDKERHDSNRLFDDQLTFGQRVADQVAAFGGSWPFIGLFFVVLIAWMIVNEELAQPFDPFPFILLNLVLSCLAALQAPVIMMSQNRMAAKDRIDARHDYDVNLRAEVQIVGLHAKLDAVREREWVEFLTLQREQLEALKRIEAQVLRPPEGTPIHDH